MNQMTTSENEEKDLKEIYHPNPQLEGWVIRWMAIPRSPLSDVLEKRFTNTKPKENEKGKEKETRESARLVAHSLSLGGSLSLSGLGEKRVRMPIHESLKSGFQKRAKTMISSSASFIDPKAFLSQVRAPELQPKTTFRSTNKRQPKLTYRPPRNMALYEALSEEQKQIHDYVVNEKKNVFFTGSAGTGKSVLLRCIINTLQSQYDTDEIGITAATGLAAINIGGITLHSFAKIGLGEKDVSAYVKTICQNRAAEKDWLRVKVLIIDEISMIDGRLLDKIEEIARRVRRRETPFGGLQVVICGDFFQLPPICKKGNAQFAFEARCWNKIIHKNISLKHCFRQKDSKLIEMLNEIRVGHVSAETERIFKSLNREPKIIEGVHPTELYPTKREVAQSNKRRLDLIKGKEYLYKARDSGRTEYLKDFKALSELTLKVGAQVMLIKKLEADLINGSLGVVTRFVEEEGLSEACPVVKFTNGKEKIIKREKWEVNIANGKYTAYRDQLPLILAWALSIHKSQGQTIEYVKVDLEHSFEEGHAYVALSRSVTMENLQVLNFSKAKVTVNQKVARFYRSMTGQ